jgi:hypothetical protein
MFLVYESMIAQPNAAPMKIGSTLILTRFQPGGYFVRVDPATVLTVSED